MNHADHLTTVDEVIDCLGGNRAVQTLTGLKSVQAVWEWRNRSVIASRFYHLMTEALASKGRTADPKLWGQAESTDQATQQGEIHAPGAQH